MNVSQLAQRAGTTADTVRHYTDLGLLAPARNPANGYRTYSRHDLARLEFVLQARSLGFTLADIQLLMAESDAGKSPCQHTRSLIEKRLEEVEQQIAELTRLSSRMRTAMQEWARQPDCAADENRVCGLIASWQEEGSHVLS